MRVLVVLSLALVAVNGQFGFPNFFGGNRRPAPAPFVSGGSSGGRGGGCVNGFHLSASEEFTWQGARDYCTRNGFRPSSLENQSKISIAYQMVRPLRFLWTGGQVNHSSRSVSWPNGATSTPDWSFTGGNRVPQPDNREGNEFCTGILNNFYGDGIKFHDIACHHRKAALCEC